MYVFRKRNCTCEASKSTCARDLGHGLRDWDVGLCVATASRLRLSCWGLCSAQKWASSSHNPAAQLFTDFGLLQSHGWVIVVCVCFFFLKQSPAVYELRRSQGGKAHGTFVLSALA